MSGFVSGLQTGAKIGAGHFGEVFHGIDEVRGQVAIKLLKQKLGETQAGWLNRKLGLLKEAQHLSQAEHANVVKVHHLLQSSSEDAILFVMEYCRGGSLQSLFENGPLDIRRTRKIATEIALGLQALHTRQMLHRDIKPANIMLDERGTAKIGDSGLVTDDIILGYGSAAGYSDHIAYEVWNGSGTSTKSDIWAFGMTIYRLLHGREFYLRSPAPRLVIANGGFADRLEWLPHIPKQWRRFLKATMKDEPSSRIANAGKLVSAIASLPIEPNWQCQLDTKEITWHIKQGGRMKRAFCRSEDANKYSWSVWSEPVTVGRNRTLGSSQAPASLRRSTKELEAFLLA